jgi:hypothetical protein
VKFYSEIIGKEVRLNSTPPKSIQSRIILVRSFANSHTHLIIFLNALISIVNIVEPGIAIHPIICCFIFVISNLIKSVQFGMKDLGHQLSIKNVNIAPY